MKLIKDFIILLFMIIIFGFYICIFSLIPYNTKIHEIHEIYNRLGYISLAITFCIYMYVIQNIINKFDK
jgi:hypothetical protein